MKKKGKNTILARSGLQSDPVFGAVVPPVFLSTTYTFDGYDGKREHDYTRISNPTRELLAQALAELDGGAGAVVTASGMSALVLALQLLRQGDTVLVSHDCFGGTFRVGSSYTEKGLYTVVFVDMNDEAALREAFTLRPKMLIAETPSNPLLRIVDVEKIVSLCKVNDCLSVIDNTFLSPVQQRPLDFGADIVWYSTTKYINGHSDVVGGALVARDKEVYEELLWWAGNLGLTGSPFDAYLTLRGMRTMDVRIRRQSHNAQQIAAMLDAHPAVSKVYYPGLSTHPGHALAGRQQDGFGSVLSFDLKGSTQNVMALVERLSCFSLAESLGGVESLVCHPATMTHRAMTEEARAKAGITDQLVRLSVGIEDADDLIGDLREALE